MNPILGWALAALLLFSAWQGYGIKGIALGVTLIVFWLVLQFNRSLRVMRNTAGSPVGRIGSAVMLNAKLRAGMQMLQVLGLTKSLGRRVDPAGEVYEWVDDGGSKVVVTFANGRCQRWTLERPSEPSA